MAWFVVLGTTAFALSLLVCPGDSQSGDPSTEDGGDGVSDCGTAKSTPAPKIGKFDILSSPAGGVLHKQLCASKGEMAGCDVCAAFDFYDDLECDTSLVGAGFCDGPDPDCAPASASYHVAPDGEDGGEGSGAQPFATVQRALDFAQPGDLIYLRGGTYRPTEQTTFSAEGTSKAPIILRSYPGEVPVIDASEIPEGNTEGASTPTWNFNGAKFWQIRGPLRLVNGRGAGVVIQGDTRDVDFVNIDSSYNGRTAARGGHGFSIVEDRWAKAKNIRFINCDAHHNANHRTRPGESVRDNLYQHGDGWRIKSGENVQLIGCRAYHNLDDNYDLVWAKNAILLYQSWSGFAGRDDAEGSTTGTPGFEAAWGEGIKLGYNDDTGRHRCIRCLSWKNVHLGFRMDGGPYLLENCVSFQNGRRALGWDLGPAPNVIRNCIDLNTPKTSRIPDTTISSHNSWDGDKTFVVAESDFVSLDDERLLGPRSSDGSLPVVDFMRLAADSDLTDAGLDGKAPFAGDAPDIGCFEHYE